MRARGASPIFPASHREPVVCFFLYLCICIPKKLSSHCRNKGGEKGKNEISFAGKLPKANYHLRLSFVLHLLIVSPSCHVDLKVGNTTQHQDIVNPKWKNRIF